MKWLEVYKKVAANDYSLLFKFLVPLAMTEVIADIGEQFLNRSVARTLNVIETLAALGLAYVLVKLFVGLVQELKPVGVVLVHDRPGFHKLLLCVIVLGVLVSTVIILIAKTQLGVWLIKDLHRVSDRVSELTYTALAYLSVYPFIEAISWYYAGVLLQYRHSTLVGIASMADIMAQIFCVAILLYTPLVCTTPIVVPILSAYCGVLTRCTITMAGFYRLVYRKLNKTVVEKVTLLQLLIFLLPLFFVKMIRRISRPMINLLVARYSPTQCEAATSLAVLTATYPLGRLGYGWLNQFRPVSPTFQLKRTDSNRPVIAGKKIGIFVTSTLAFSFVLSLTLYWIPGVSVAILVYAVGIPHDLALLCVDPLRVFAFYCFTVSVRASLTGWLTLHKQTKLLIPSGLIRIGSILAVFFALRELNVTGALLGVIALFAGFLFEAVALAIIAPIYACWRTWKQRRSMLVQAGSDLTAPVPMETSTVTQTDLANKTVDVVSTDTKLINDNIELENSSSVSERTSDNQIQSRDMVNVEDQALGEKQNSVDETIL